MVTAGVSYVTSRAEQDAITFTEDNIIIYFDICGILITFYPESSRIY